MVLNSPFTKTLYIDLSILCFGAVSQSYLRCCLPGCSPHFAPNKTTHNSQVVHLFLVNITFYPLTFQCAFTKNTDIFLNNLSKINKFVKFNSNTVLYSNPQSPLQCIQLCQ